MQAALSCLLLLRGGADGTVGPAQKIGQRVILPLGDAAAEHEGALRSAVVALVEKPQPFVRRRVIQRGQAVQDDACVAGADSDSGR